ncbi:MAG: polysaccharide export protein [Bryobacterales bacterium]|nr:polysaccharide export protein [Bryobacterales bacterium]
MAVIAVFGQIAATLSAQEPTAANPTAALSSDSLRPSYVLGPGDQILVRAFEMEEIGERPMLVDGDGNLNIPVLGIVHAAGTTVAQLEAKLIVLLKKYVKEPRVTITIVQFRSEPVFFVGAFQRPGIYPLQGRRTLVEMLSAIGGLQPNASRYIKVSRRKEVGSIPLSNAVSTPDGKGSSVRISLGSLRDNVNPAEDIVLEPFDVVTVEKAELIYVNGAIGHVGGIDLLEKDSMSVTQLVTMAGGLKDTADPTKARLLRPVLNTSKRAEIHLNVERIMAGKDTDFPVLPNDLLYIPTKSGFKQNLGKGLLIALPIGITLAVLLTRTL